MTLRTDYVHPDHLGTPQRLTDRHQQIVWDAVYAPFGEVTLRTEQVMQPLRFPGQYADPETGLHPNWHRDYDPALGRYLQSDPIGLSGGINTYAYVGSNPIRYTDPTGLERWDFDGQGDTSACTYYDQKVEENPNCSYYKETAKICRGQNAGVNTLTGVALGAAYLSPNFTDSQSVVLTTIRNNLIEKDAAARAGGSVDACGCTRGDDIDAYHNQVFEDAGLSPIFYGGNLSPQNFGPNPVPYDPRGFDPLDDLFNLRR
jgi:RHS repeat-associated protein